MAEGRLPCGGERAWQKEIFLTRHKKWAQIEVWLNLSPCPKPRIGTLRVASCRGWVLTSHSSCGRCTRGYFDHSAVKGPWGTVNGVVVSWMKPYSRSRSVPSGACTTRNCSAEEYDRTSISSQLNGGIEVPPSCGTAVSALVQALCNWPSQQTNILISKEKFLHDGNLNWLIWNDTQYILMKH